MKFKIEKYRNLFERISPLNKGIINKKIKAKGKTD